MDPRVFAELRSAGVLAAWLFGSRARGDMGELSDVDLAVLRDLPLPLLHEQRLVRALERLLGLPVDLVDFLAAPLELRARVVHEGRLLYSDDEPRRVAETVLVQSRWEDVRRALAEMDRAFLGRVAAGGLAGG